MQFEQAVEIILKNEGGLVDHPQDPGGVTNFGISLKAYPQLGREGIINMTASQAKEIYRRDYWDKLQCDKLPGMVRLGVFDFAVNSGVSQAVKTLQKVVGTTPDGVIGPKTINAAWTTKDVPINYAKERMRFYGKLTLFATFGLGWSLRVLETLA